MPVQFNNTLLCNGTQQEICKTYNENIITYFEKWTTTFFIHYLKIVDFFLLVLIPQYSLFNINEIKQLNSKLTIFIFHNIGKKNQVG